MARPADERSISVVLPALDEEDNIGDAVDACVSFLEPRFRSWEVIVVDDGSTDHTPEIVGERSSADPHVRLVRFDRNRGYGAALARGFREARGDVVFFTDADLQFDVRELKDALPLLEDHDVVFGFRVYRYDSVLRCLLSWTYNRLVRVLFGIGVRDVDCSFKLFSRRVVDRLELESTDFFVDTEMVARVARLGARSVEKGVRHYPRRAGKTSVRPSDVPRTLLTVARMWWRIRILGGSSSTRSSLASRPSRNGAPRR